jgi:hypothetical protein
MKATRKRSAVESAFTLIDGRENVPFLVPPDAFDEMPTAESKLLYVYMLRRFNARYDEMFLRTVATDLHLTEDAVAQAMRVLVDLGRIDVKYAAWALEEANA